MKEKIIGFLGGMLVGAIIVGVGALGKWVISKKQCDAKGQQMEVRTEYDFWGGCFVNTKNGKMPLNQILEIVE